MLVLVTPPAPIVSLIEAKAHLRLDHSDDDAYLDSLIATATARLDGPNGHLGRALGEQTWTEYRTAWPCYRVIGFAMQPIQSVIKVEYVTAAGATVEMDGASYGGVFSDTAGAPYVRLGAAVDLPALADRDDAVRVTFVAGYPRDLVPAPIRHAILMMVGQLYANRGEMVKGDLVEDPSIKALLAGFRVLGI